MYETCKHYAKWKETRYKMLSIIRSLPTVNSLEYTSLQRWNMIRGYQELQQEMWVNA